jgi:hypothetical protein
MKTFLRVLGWLAIAGLILLVGGVILLRALFSRTREFRAKAESGQPIVRAIEQYKKDSGTYPASLADLAPKYLPVVPDLPDESKSKFEGWDYRTETNGVLVSYSLRYYMGRGGVEYEPPTWSGNDEGHRTVLFKNE